MDAVETTVIREGEERVVQIAALFAQWSSIRGAGSMVGRGAGPVEAAALPIEPSFLCQIENEGRFGTLSGIIQYDTFRAVARIESTSTHVDLRRMNLQ